MTNWYTADPHFGQDNILIHCDRPFQSVNEMNTAIIANYKACVQPGDDFWIIGDFGFGHSAAKNGYLEKIFKAIPGNKHLIIGNHDNDRVKNLPWKSVSELAEIKDEKHPVVLCHYPMITWHRARRGALQLFGHVHERWQGTNNSINVGVDVWNFMPVRLDDIRKRADTLPVNSYFNIVEPKSASE